MAETTTTTEAFEALMPEPFWHAVISEQAPIINKAIRRRDVADDYVAKCDENYPGAKVVELYTADQMREAIRAATERAATLCEDVDEPAWYGYECPNTFQDGVSACAAAIRASSGKGESDV